MPSDRVAVEMTILDLRATAHALDMYAIRLRKEGKDERAEQLSSLADTVTLACLAAAPVSALVKDVDWDWEREVSK